MSEIEKLKTRILNSEKWNSSELRISVEDAKKLLHEINEIKNSVVVEKITLPEKESHTSINMDGGTF